MGAETTHSTHLEVKGSIPGTQRMSRSLLSQRSGRVIGIGKGDFATEQTVV